MNRRRRGVRLGAALVALALCAPLSPAQGQAGGPPSEWKVTYLGGYAQWEEGAKLRATIGAKWLTLSAGGIYVSIPIEGIIDVNCGSRARYPMWDAQMKIWRFVAEGTQGQGLLFMPFATPLLLVSLANKKRDFLVDILWEEEGAEQDMVIAISEKDYSSFVEALGRATGKPIRNLKEDWARIEQEIQKEKGNKFEIRLDRKVLLGGAELKPGKYQVVFVPRGEDSGEVYLFYGRAADVSKLTAASPVMFVAVIGGVEPYPSHTEIAGTTPAQSAPGTGTATEVVYEEGVRGATILEIRTPKRTYRLAPAATRPK